MVSAGSVCVLLAMCFLASSTLGRPGNSSEQVSCTFNETTFAIGAMWPVEGECNGWICQDDGTIASLELRYTTKPKSSCPYLSSVLTPDFLVCADTEDVYRGDWSLQTTALRQSIDAAGPLSRVYRQCRVYKLREGCAMVEGDATKDYPECCDQPSCPDFAEPTVTEPTTTSS